MSICASLILYVCTCYLSEGCTFEWNLVSMIVNGADPSWSRGSAPEKITWLLHATQVDFCTCLHHGSTNDFL